MKGEKDARQERKETFVENPKTQFIIKGFRQVRESRVFAFEGIAADWTRTRFAWHVAAGTGVRSSRIGAGAGGESSDQTAVWEYGAAD